MSAGSMGYFYWLHVKSESPQNADRADHADRAD